MVAQTSNFTKSSFRFLFTYISKFSQFVGIDGRLKTNRPSKAIFFCGALSSKCGAKWKQVLYSEEGCPNSNKNLWSSENISILRLLFSANVIECIHYLFDIYKCFTLIFNRVFMSQRKQLLRKWKRTMLTLRFLFNRKKSVTLFIIVPIIIEHWCRTFIIIQQVMFNDRQWRQVFNQITWKWTVIWMYISVFLIRTSSLLKNRQQWTFRIRPFDWWMHYIFDNKWMFYLNIIFMSFYLQKYSLLGAGYWLVMKKNQ